MNIKNSLFDSLKKDEVSNLHKIVGGREYGSTTDSTDAKTHAVQCDKWTAEECHDSRGFLVADGGVFKPCGK